MLYYYLGCQKENKVLNLYCVTGRERKIYGLRYKPSHRRTYSARK
jgi:hypothetical protein